MQRTFLQRDRSKRKRRVRNDHIGVKERKLEWQQTEKLAETNEIKMVSRRNEETQNEEKSNKTQNKNKEPEMMKPKRSKK